MSKSPEAYARKLCQVIHGDGWVVRSEKRQLVCVYFGPDNDRCPDRVPWPFELVGIEGETGKTNEEVLVAEYEEID